jgi:hypothetical protein
MLVISNEISIFVKRELPCALIRPEKEAAHGKSSRSNCRGPFKHGLSESYLPVMMCVLPRADAPIGLLWAGGGRGGGRWEVGG